MNLETCSSTPRSCESCMVKLVAKLDVTILSYIQIIKLCFVKVQIISINIGMDNQGFIVIIVGFLSDVRCI